MITRVFKVTEDKETNSTIHQLGVAAAGVPGGVPTHSFSGAEEKADFFNSIAAVQGIGVDQKKRELSKLLFLGHAHEGFYGDFSPQEFAERFAASFLGPAPEMGFLDRLNPLYQARADAAFNPEDKSLVQDIYLVGCELGSYDPPNNNSFAQQLADCLYEKGFSNVKVHAIAYEKANPDESMYVEVDENRGAKGSIPKVLFNESGELTPYDTITPGYLNAYSVSPTMTAEIRNLRSVEEQALGNGDQRSAKAAREKIDALLKEPKENRSIVSSAPPLSCLDRAENTFIPKKNRQYKPRAERVLADESFRDRQNKKRAIAVMAAHLKGLSGSTALTNSQDVVVQSFMAWLKKEDDKLSFKQICAVHEGKFKAELPGIFSKDTSNATYQLLKNLSQGIFPDLSSKPKIVSKNSEEKVAEHKQDRHRKPEAVPNTRPSSRNNPAVSANPSTMYGGKGRGPQRPENNPQRNLNDEQKAILNAFISKISALEAKLLTEVKELELRKGGSYSPFIDFEIATKTRKMDCLTDLSRMKDLASLQKQAAEYLKKDIRVTWRFRNTTAKTEEGEKRWFASRTKDLLTEIVNSRLNNKEKQSIAVEDKAVVDSSVRPDRRH